MRLSSAVGLSFCHLIFFFQDIKYVDFIISHFSEGFEVLNAIF